MKHQIALLLLGFVALSSASGYNLQMRKTLQSIPVPKNYQHHPLESASVSAGAPGASFGAGAPGAPSVDDIAELPQEQPVQVVYKAPTRVIERQPIRVAPSSSSYSRGSDDAPPPKRGHGGAATSKHRKPLDDEELTFEEDEFARSAANAQYSFASAVDDGIQDQSHIRQETRDGLKVTGTYAYSDGYFKRTVNYEADENGYRVVGETVEPLGEDGPQVDLVNGKAEVHTQIGGVNTQYSVSADELALNSRRADSLSKKEKEAY